jgi:hypothetical protein
MKSMLAWSPFALTVLLGCSEGSSSGSDPTPGTDAGQDATNEASADSALDAVGDSPIDAAQGDAAGNQDAPQTCAWEKVNITVTLGPIRGISGTSPNDIILVGSGPYEWMIVTSNGAKWSNAAQGGTRKLYDVAAVSGGTAWAVGMSDTSDTLVMQRSAVGGPWTEQTLSDNKMPLQAVWGVAPDKAFAVGWFNAIARYDGQGWTKVAFTPAQQVSFNDVWASSDSDVHAVGSIADGQIYHFDGSTWTQTWTGSSPVTRIAGRSSTEVYATYTFGLLRYDGQNWSEMDLGSFKGKFLPASVWVSPKGTVYVGGQVLSPAAAIVIAYDGVDWKDTGSLNSQLGVNKLWGVEDTLFAVGALGTDTDLHQYKCK